MIDLANMTENSTLLDLQNRVRALESGNTVYNAPQVMTVTKPAPVAPPTPQPVVKAPQVQVAEKVEAKDNVSQNPVKDEFTPPPMSKKASGNDIASLWQMLLMNIKSPSTTALLKLATPLQIGPDGVVLTFKNERLVAQISESNKKQLIIDAANVMFNQDSTPVTVRMAQSGDKVISASAVLPKQEIETSSSQSVEKPAESKALQNSSMKENKEDEVSKEKKVERLESDQEKMVLELFDGKYVE